MTGVGGNLSVCVHWSPVWPPFPRAAVENRRSKKSVGDGLEHDLGKIPAFPVMENNEFVRTVPRVARLTPEHAFWNLSLQPGLLPNNLTPKASPWQRTMLGHHVSSFC